MVLNNYSGFGNHYIEIDPAVIDNGGIFGANGVSIKSSFFSVIANYQGRIYFIFVVRSLRALIALCFVFSFRLALHIYRQTVLAIKF